jgi:hypothetical protein
MVANRLKDTTWNIEYESRAKIAVLQLPLSSGALKIARCRVLWREIKVAGGGEQVWGLVH